MSADREQLYEWVIAAAAYAHRCGVTEQLRAALVREPVLHSRASFPSGPSARPAGADEPEADPPQTVAADPSIVDSESDPSYRDRVQHAETTVLVSRDPEQHREFITAAADAVEAERQAWLRRVQAQPIR